jgi:N-dimethylarginine dimethylaminohydrolase
LECPSRIEAKETLAINFVALEPGKIVMTKGNPRTQELLEESGINVITVDFDEILKGFGAIHCCTAFLKRD